MVSFFFCFFQMVYKTFMLRLVSRSKYCVSMTCSHWLGVSMLPCICFRTHAISVASYSVAEHNIRCYCNFIVFKLINFLFVSYVLNNTFFNQIKISKRKLKENLIWKKGRFNIRDTCDRFDHMNLTAKTTKKIVRFRLGQHTFLFFSLRKKERLQKKT